MLPTHERPAPVTHACPTCRGTQRITPMGKLHAIAVRCPTCRPRRHPLPESPPDVSGIRPASSRAVPISALPPRRFFE